MTLGIPCNSCAHDTCGSCVAEKLEGMGFIQSAKYHCSCANKGHHNTKSQELPNKTVFSSKKDTDPAHPREIQGNTDDEYRDDES